MVSTEKGMSRYLEMLGALRLRGMIPSDIRTPGTSRVAQTVKQIKKARAAQTTAAASNHTENAALVEKHRAEVKRKMAEKLTPGCRLDYIPSVGNGL